MDFYQLEALIAVAEQGSFSRAADRLFRTQSAISQAVKKLEEQLGVVLFDRRAPTLIPTEAGRILIEHAREIVSSRARAIEAVDLLRHAHTGRVTIAAIESAAQYLVPEILRVFCQQHPEVEIEVQRKPNAAVPQQILDRSAQIGICAAEPPLRKLRWIELFAEPLVLIVPPGHRLTGRREAHVEELGDERFFVHHVGTQTTQRVIALFEEHRTPLHIAARLWSYEDVKSFVREGMGVAIVPRMCVRQELADGTLARVWLPELDWLRHIGLVSVDEPYVEASARKLLEMVQGRHWSWTDRSPAGDGP